MKRNTTDLRCPPLSPANPLWSPDSHHGSLVNLRVLSQIYDTDRATRAHQRSETGSYEPYQDLPEHLLTASYGPARVSPSPGAAPAPWPPLSAVTAHAVDQLQYYARAIVDTDMAWSLNLLRLRGQADSLTLRWWLPEFPAHPHGSHRYLLLRLRQELP